ncbi:MAG TPA: YdeI/OmpD-associated family protein [Streptosporangiaceae bacterium]|nr:YdeI/OmpD-associated family protein [Streptosporangiaceae bacterium]
MDPGDLPVRSFPDAAAWREWLVTEGATAAGVWLKTARKGAAEPTVSYAEAVEVALCFGWIDGQKRPLDDSYWLQRFTPRKPGSRWSLINTQKAEAQIAAGRMQPAGMREVEAAKADGRWQRAYANQRSAEVPEDLRQALAANSAAAEFFATISRINRYAILYRIQTVKRPETRARKIQQYVQMLAEHKTIHP